MNDTLTAGSRLGPYEIVAPIGEGGMGRVYRATDTKLKRQVAIKVLPPEVAGDADHLARFRREAEVLASLNHPHIAAVYGFEDSASNVSANTATHALVMELVEGSTLADRIAGGALPVTDALRLAEQVADALADAHGRGIVHRDIKPGNIMLAARGSAKVLDFGLAKRVTSADAGDAETLKSLTRAGTIVGTTAYMAPEQLRGEEPDARADVFGLGCVVYEMITGRHPFLRATTAETVGALLHEPAPPLPSHVPVELQRIVRKCLDKDRERRYSSGRDLLIDLRNLIRDSTETGRSPVSASSPTNARLRVIAVLVFATLAAGAGWLWLRPAAGPGRSVRVLAILPLATGDPSSEFLGEGISETVINNLSQVPELKVLARATTFRYRGSDVDIAAAIGRDLGGLELLHRTIQAGAMSIFYKDQPTWQPVRRDPRFVEALRQMRIPADPSP